MKFKIGKTVVKVKNGIMFSTKSFGAKFNSWVSRNVGKLVSFAEKPINAMPNPIKSILFALVIALVFVYFLIVVLALTKLISGT